MRNRIATRRSDSRDFCARIFDRRLEASESTDNLIKTYKYKKTTTIR